MAVSSGLYFLSCSSDDDDEQGGSSSIVGTWLSTDIDSYSGVDEEYVMFCADGTGYEFEEDSYYGVEVEKFEYIYNAQRSTLTIIEDGYSDVLEVISLTKNQLIIGSGSGGVEPLKKVNSPYTQAQLEKLYRAQR